MNEEECNRRREGKERPGRFFLFFLKKLFIFIIFLDLHEQDVISQTMHNFGCMNSHLSARCKPAS